MPRSDLGRMWGCGAVPGLERPRISPFSAGSWETSCQVLQPGSAEPGEDLNEVCTWGCGRVSQLGFAHCRCPWKLPRKDFLGHFSSCTSCSKLLPVAALHPFLGHLTAAPLFILLQKLLPTAACPLPGMQIFSGD